MKEKFFKNKSGFTIIETMISISVFLVVVLYGTNALLSANQYSRHSEATRSLLDNLSFSMEEMSRSLRTGSDFHCITDGNTVATSALSCPSGGLNSEKGISFMPSSGGSRWVYYLRANADGSLFLEKSTDGGNTFVPLTTSEIKINPSSNFFVVGAEPPPPPPPPSISGDLNQPFVKIWLTGTIKEKNTDTPFSLQTSVSQRIPDLNTP